MTTERTRDAVASGDLGFVDPVVLREWLVEQRWFGSKARPVAELNVLEALALRRDDQPLLTIALVEVRFQTGTHELYQLPLGLRPATEGWASGVISEVDGWTVYDALTDPQLAAELLGRIRDATDVPGRDGVGAFGAVETVMPSGVSRPVRAISGEQSNSSLVFGDDELVLKVYRRVEPGTNPELELLAFLTRNEFSHIARLAGWYGYRGPLVEATLGILQEFVSGARDGWDLILEAVAGGDPDAPIAHLDALGRVVGEMHAVLGSDSADPAFAPEEPTPESIGLLTATVDEEIDAIFLDLPETEATAPIVGRGEEVRDRLRQLAQVSRGGRVIRHHGDLHLGQTLLRGGDWVILDFEGEPARSLPERRRKRSPLRDVAGMLRSLAYAAAASERMCGVAAPDGWEQRARDAFMAGYFETVDRTLLPPSEDALRRLLSIFELEKAVYELRYELNNRPDWVAIPAAGIAALLDR